MTWQLARIAFLTAIAIPSTAWGSPPAADPLGVLRKPIPDRIVVLTFDDGPASHATVVAPILKSLGFGGSFYICDFDSFPTRKDWYLTWRQIRALARDGFEIGNHTRGHAGGSPIGPILAMEDELLANHCPKTTTLAWPVYQANANTFPDLAGNGYTFARGGYYRPYRPTADNPFDIPSLWASDMPTFVRCVRQATRGRIVVLTFHGVPDMEHPTVGIAPALFREMMQYLKDNHYKAIVLRDLTEYIDPARAARLPPTAAQVNDAGPVELLVDEKPYVAPKAVADATPKSPAGGRKTDAASRRASSAGEAAGPGRTVELNKPGRFNVPSDVRQDFTLRQMVPGDVTVANAVALDARLTVNVARNGQLVLQGPIAGKGSLVKRGPGQLRINETKNSYSGGTTVDEGSFMVLTANEGLGTGPVTLNDDASLDLENVSATNTLVLNGGTINAGNGFGDRWDGNIVLNGNTRITSYADFLINSNSGGMSGPGGFTQIGGVGGFGPVNAGQVTLCGTNRYAGPTIVMLGTLRVLKAGALYSADPTALDARSHHGGSGGPAAARRRRRGRIHRRSLACC